MECYIICCSVRFKVNYSRPLLLKLYKFLKLAFSNMSLKSYKDSSTSKFKFLKKDRAGLWYNHPPRVIKTMISFLKIINLLVSLVVISLHLYYFEQVLCKMTTNHLFKVDAISNGANNRGNMSVPSYSNRAVSGILDSERILYSKLPRCQRHTPVNKGTSLKIFLLSLFSSLQNFQEFFVISWLLFYI